MEYFGIMCRFDPILNRVWVTKDTHRLTRRKKDAYRTTDRTEAEKLMAELSEYFPDYVFSIAVHTPGKKK